MSRIEQILLACINGSGISGCEPPQSRVEALLYKLYDVISQGGGGGGTSNHSQLTHRNDAEQHPMSAITGLEDALDDIEEVIPAQASSSNQLADKDFVNSSIGTNTAYYISNNGQPFNSVAELQAYAGTVTNNDYAFVTGTDAIGNPYFDRYKATVSGSTVTWAKEYRLNNSSFTAAQWAAISSGITAYEVGLIGTAVQPRTLSAYRTSSAQDTIDNGKEATSNKVTSLSSSSTNAQYPSAKCVYDLVGNIEATLNAIRGV